MAANLPTPKSFVLDHAGDQCAVLFDGVDCANPHAQYAGHFVGRQFCAGKCGARNVASLALDTKRTG